MHYLHSLHIGIKAIGSNMNDGMASATEHSPQVRHAGFFDWLSSISYRAVTHTSKYAKPL